MAAGGSSLQLETVEHRFQENMRLYWPKPEALDGKESNWLETIPGKSWFCILRMYGPLEPWINKTWRPSEIELVK